MTHAGLSKLNDMLAAIAITAMLATAALPCSAIAEPFEDAQSAIAQGDYTMAVAILGLLAGRGDPRVQHRLGILHDSGLGVPLNKAEAAAWFRKAADQGYVQAQNSLGFMYFSGRGLPQDYIESYKWYHLAATGSPSSENEARFTAGKCLTGLSVLMSPAQITEALELAAAWKAQPVGGVVLPDDPATDLARLVRPCR